MLASQTHDVSVHTSDYMRTDTHRLTADSVEQLADASTFPPVTCDPLWSAEVIRQRELIKLIGSCWLANSLNPTED